MGWKIGIINWSFKNMKFDVGKPGQDIARHLKAGIDQSVFNFPGQVIVIKENQYGLREIISMMEDLDIIFIESQLDDVGAYPQVILVKNKNDIASYTNEFTVAVSSIDRDLASDHPLFVPFDSLIDVLVKKSFPLLPGLDCGHCGNVNCEEMMISLIKGKNRVEDCEPKRLQFSDYELVVNGERVPCTGFVEEIIKNTVIGMVSALKGVNTAIEAVKLEFKTEKRE
jgi:molybdopterin-guanine dinucleotide biosynthesis protein MobB